MNIAHEITKIYLKEENWHSKKLDEESANLYHQKLLDDGNIITVTSGELLHGYCEFWKLNFEQFGRIICGEPFSPLHEDVVHGQIAYVANTFIRPEARRGQVFKMLRDRFFQANCYATHFVGEARRKSCAPLKVFKREKLASFIKF